jgi:hypothetical protein
MEHSDQTLHDAYWRQITPQSLSLALSATTIHNPNKKKKKSFITTSVSKQARNMDPQDMVYFIIGRCGYGGWALLGMVLIFWPVD